MKVLQVSCEGMGNGGVQAVIMGICRHMPDVHYDIILFTSERRYYDDEFEMLGGKIFRIPNYEGLSKIRRKLDYFLRFFRIFMGTYKIIKKNGPYQAIHCHNYFESGICTFAASIAGVKVRISHSHNSVPPIKIKRIKRFYDYFLKILIKINSNIKIGCSEQAITYLYGNDKNAFVVNNAIDLKRFNREKYPYKYHKCIKFIHVGRYCFQKNQLFLLDVFYHTKKLLDDAQLTMIGFGKDEEKIEKKIIKLGLEENVQMLPSDSDIPKLLSESDYFIFPSNYEGYSIVLLEAQAMGVKCFVSTNVPQEANMGLCEYLDLKKGAKAWAEYILKYKYNNNRYNREFVHDEVLKRYNIQEICKIYKGIYEGRED
jgi:glycosyltransferase involved in cell wall biosynthesis